MFEVHGTSPRALRHLSVPALSALFSSALFWPIGRPERYDINTTDQWRPFAIHPWCADALAQRVQVVRVVCERGLLAIDTGLQSGNMRWILAGSTGPTLEEADRAARAWLLAGMERVWIHHPPSTAAFRTNYPDAVEEQTALRVWEQEGESAARAWPVTWSDAPDATLLRAMRA